MGNSIKEQILGGTIDNQMVLLGIESQGKTKFLYENHIKSKTSYNLSNSLGFNYEVINYENSDVAVWDLAGSEEFQQLWDVFLTTVPFSTIAFVICPYVEGSQAEINLDYIARSRKLLHYIANEFTCSDKILMVILNVYNNSYKRDDETDEELKQKVQEQVKDLLMWQDLQQEFKSMVILDFNNYLEYETVWKQQQTIYKEYKKKIKNQDKVKEKQ